MKNTGKGDYSFLLNCREVELAGKVDILLDFHIVERC